MEKSGRVAVVPVDMGWSDVGCWDAFYEISDCDEHGNVVDGDVIALETNNCLLKSNGVRVAALGVRELVIVATGDTVLVVPRDRAQDVRELAKAADLAETIVAPAALLEGAA